ncbi:hypothetical protein RY831_11510 [Noviherbaspirillum sp. CPCC 100848]|uniref:Uncharacterized protein n=1 Tax=Noviherbaspirillum album TaxID=3080276 RepID=A0ABU6J8L6_9BURK|nr:hypothetical protein [Noviherbaspirillum sp. CPCC 100848]MEC4719778.1 hypothetical protein [Noviherbaspirillum sp. CPCC 100848]
MRRWLPISPAAWPMPDSGWRRRRRASGFIPLAEERYFFAVKKKALDLPTVTTAVGLLRSEAFLAAVSELKGYDASAAGRVTGVEEAFAAGRGKQE